MRGVAEPPQLRFPPVQAVKVLSGVLVAAMLAAGCGGDDGSASGTTSADGSTTTTVEVPSEPDPALAALGELLDDEGALGVDAAQRLFAAVVAPLPGVEPLDLPDGELPTDAGGLAARRLLAPDVDPAVAEAVTAALEPADGEEEIIIEPGGRRREGVGGLGTGDAPELDELAADVESLVAQLEERSGHDLRFAVRARVVPDRSTGGDAVTTPIGTGDRPIGCRVALPQGLFGGDEPSVTSTIVHELWHCFQLDVNPAAFTSGPAWIIEGQAEWAGEAHVGGSPSSAGSWNTWLLELPRALARRSYDAIGLFGVAEATGVDPWRAMLPMLGRSGNAAVESLFGTSAADAVRGVAQALVRAPAVGAAWESTGPGITGAQGAEVLAVTPDGGAVEATSSVGRFATLPVVLAIRQGDVLAVSVSGGDAAAVAVPEAGTTAVAPGSTMRWCMRPEGCVCPDGSNPGGGEALPPAGPGEGAAAVGSLAGGDLSVRAELVSLEDACEQTIVGQWTADASVLLPILLAAYGGGEGPSCTGPFVLTFAPDGAFVGQMDVTCTVGDISGHGTARFDARWITDGPSLNLVDLAGSGQMQLGGHTMPLPIVDGFRQAFGNPATYVIEGDQLAVTFNAPDAGAVTLTYTRVA